jgi:hypothetical protein
MAVGKVSVSQYRATDSMIVSVGGSSSVQSRNLSPILDFGQYCISVTLSPFREFTMLARQGGSKKAQEILSIVS